MSTDYKFEGWMGLDKESAKGNMVWQEYEPKVWEETDVDIKISHCGICGSDLHMLSSGWSDAVPYPCCVGHEIVGKAVRVGKEVKHIQVGDRVGVGAQAGACLKSDCYECSNGLEAYCKKLIATYGFIYPDGKGKSYGGYAKYNRTNGHFVVKIPEGVASEDAAPMLCGGVTVYSPLIQNGIGPGKKVGVIGVGGLGHFAILFAKAMGAEVVGISRKADKKEDSLALGASKYIATAEDKDWASENSRSLDLIICTVSSDKMPMTQYLQLLKIHGKFVQVGIPDGGHLPAISAFSIVTNGINVGGSHIGGPWEIREMLELAAKNNIKAWVQKVPMKDANKAIVDMEAGKARYRYVLVNDDE